VKETKELIDLRQKVDDLGSLLVDIGERLLEINSKLEEWIRRSLEENEDNIRQI